MSGQVLKYYLNDEARACGIELKIPRALDAGFDLPCLNPTTIEPGGFTLIKTGLHFGIPEGWVGLLRDRSSVALRGGAITAGVIDASYRGEVKVAMHNLGKEPLIFESGERIAQMVLVEHFAGEQSFQVQKLEELGDTDRGYGGFGSTGRK